MVKAPDAHSGMKAAGVSREASAATASAVAKEAIRLKADTTRIDAAGFHDMRNVMVYDSYPDLTGRQVNFQKNQSDSWISYTIDAPEAGTYSLVMELAAPNRSQVFYVSAGKGPAATMNIPNTRGLWGMTQPLDIRLEKGEQPLRIAAPNQRGIAVKWLELKRKG
jgi:hypothetical protein